LTPHRIKKEQRKSAGRRPTTTTTTTTITTVIDWAELEMRRNKIELDCFSAVPQ
jgi:hypothetical protein